MLTTRLKQLASSVQDSAFFVYISARVYRFARVFCVLMEDKFPGISFRAGFKVSINWTEDLGFSVEE